MRAAVLSLACTLFVFACQGEPPLSSVAPATSPAASAGPVAASLPPTLTGGRLIVTLAAAGDSAEVAAVARAHGVVPEFVYSHAIHGFAAVIPEPALRSLLRDTRIASVEPDGVVRIAAMPATASVQADPPWGLDRIDQRALPLDYRFSYRATGAGVTAYVIDTGLRFDHVEFERRARSLFDAVDGGRANDCEGHGTHVAGILGGRTYGVAKDVSLVAVRVLDCTGEGTWSGVIAGIDRVVADHAAGEPAVANLSLGGEVNRPADAAVRSMIADGVATVVAAGNAGANACNFSPAGVTEAMTIAASTKSDTKPYWSNFGECVDWFAPGAAILSASVWSRTASATLSGTSMAAPHTAGAAALYLETHPTATPIQVRNVLLTKTTKDAVLHSSTPKNHLLFTNF